MLTAGDTYTHIPHTSDSCARIESNQLARRDSAWATPRRAARLGHRESSNIHSDTEATIKIRAVAGHRWSEPRGEVGKMFRVDPVRWMQERNK